MKSKIFIIILIVIAIISIFALQSGKQPENESKVVVSITLDTEYNYGIGFPDTWTQEEKLANTPTKETWIKTINTLNDISKENNIRLQFNVVGKTALDYVELIQEISKNNDISCQSYSHKRQSELSKEEKQFEIAKCKEILENITGKQIIGNRFPYTSWEEESFDILKQEGYKWDTSLWADTFSGLKPYQKKGITEFPILTKDDYQYFMQEENTDAKEFYNLIKNNINDAKDLDVNYIILLHPWVLSLEEDRINELENFIKTLKYNKISIKSLDEIYNNTFRKSVSK